MFVSAWWQSQIRAQHRGRFYLTICICEGMQFNGSLFVYRWHRFRWTPASRLEGLTAEHKLVTATTNGAFSQHDVRVGPHKEDIIHYLKGGEENPSAPPLVTVPGYSSGSGFLFRILGGLAQGFQVFAVDLLGTGCSGRPPFKAKTTEEAEDFFVDSLEVWRERTGIDKMVLMGHSLGGYLSTVYALRYPERVVHLILVSPAGIVGKPVDWKPPATLQNSLSFRGQLFRFSMKLFEWGMTPGMIARGTGPLGKRMIEGYCNNRFKQGHHLTEYELMHFKGYAYQAIAQRGSGEHALRHLLAPFAWPQKPLEDRMSHLQVPVTFMYGEQDWMRPEGAREAIKKLKQNRKKLVKSDMSIYITPNSGHWLFMDQPSLFLQQFGEACSPHMPEKARNALLNAAKSLPYYSQAPGDTEEELAEEMKENPAKAEVHIAADM